MRESTFIVGFALVVAGRMVLERGLRHLTAEHKIRLLDAFSRQRMLAAVPVLLTLGLAFGVMRFRPEHRSWVPEMTAALGILYLLLLSVRSWRRLATLRMPDGYMKAFGVSRLLQVLGICVLYSAFLSLNRF